MINKVLFLAAMALTSTVLPGYAMAAADAGAYPDKPIRIVVPYPAGGSTDALTRTLGQKVGETLGQPVIVENRAGASGSIGTGFAAKAAPDGYTLVLGASSTLSVNQSLYKQLPYDAGRDFIPIVLATMQPSVVVVPKSLNVNSMQELTSLLKSGRLNASYGSAGNGTPSHMGGELYKHLTGVKANHIPYRGGAPALTDLAGGQLTYMFAILAEALPLVKAGQLKMLAVTTANRLPAFPDLPTVAETGVPTFELIGWYGYLAPTNTPTAIVDKLNQSFNHALRDPVVQRKLTAMGLEILGGNPARLSAQMGSDEVKWRNLIERAGIKLD